MTGEKANTYGSRPRANYIKVFLSADERQQLDERAKSAGMSLSAYLRAAGLHHEIRSVYDLGAVNELMKVTGDLGRVAGLLKLWLADYRGFGAKPAEVEKMMEDFRALQADMRGVMGKAVRR